jgi:hypothetical protein
LYETARPFILNNALATDFLDPKKQRRHAILLYTGYFFIGVAIIISTIVLVYQANGFGVNRNGQVVQNGLLFFSSQPTAADIYLNDKKQPQQTNTRLSVPAGQYEARISREGYRNWTRTINVQGGDVQNFDYPFLFPEELQSTARKSYDAPGISTQSLDRRWLLVQQSATSTIFDLYDIRAEIPEAEPLQLPAEVVGATTGTWEVVQWADNNRHVLLKHGSDYILLDRDNIAESVNLTDRLSLTTQSLTLIDNKFDRYHLLTPETGLLEQATLERVEPVSVLENVLQFKSYGSRTVLYATAQDAPEGRVNVMMLVGDKKYVIREVAANTTYLLDLAGYRGAQYVVLGAASENMIYVYKEPVEQLKGKDVEVPEATRALKITNPTRVSFSQNAQYIAAQGGTQFGVYDFFLKRATIFTLSQQFDQGQKYATWMDSNHLTYVSGGKQLVFDQDRRNQQSLMASLPAHSAYFTPNYQYAYTLAVNEAGETELLQTPLRTEADL